MGALFHPQEAGQGLGDAGGHAPEHRFCPHIEGHGVKLASPLVIASSRNRIIGKVLRELLFHPDLVDIGLMAEDPVQGQGKDVVDLGPGPGIFISVDNTDKGIEPDTAGACGLLQFTHDLDLVAADAEFLHRLADGRLHRGLPPLDPPSREADLAGLGVEPGGPDLIEDMKCPVPDQDRDQDGGASLRIDPPLPLLCLLDPSPQSCRGELRFFLSGHLFSLFCRNAKGSSSARKCMSW